MVKHPHHHLNKGRLPVHELYWYLKLLLTTWPPVYLWWLKPIPQTLLDSNHRNTLSTSNSNDHLLWNQYVGFLIGNQDLSIFHRSSLFKFCQDRHELQFSGHNNKSKDSCLHLLDLPVAMAARVIDWSLHEKTKVWIGFHCSSPSLDGPNEIFHVEQLLSIFSPFFRLNARILSSGRI